MPIWWMWRPSQKPSVLRLQGESRYEESDYGPDQGRTHKKEDVLTGAQIAGIAAAKRTSDLIPFYHPLPIPHIDISIAFEDNLPGVLVKATVKTADKTGVEMEALPVISLAALTIHAMAKAAEKTMKIQNIRLSKKHGGQPGDVMNE